ncbi:MAG: methyltransferase [Flammeovirgaceae bacterium]|nr:methyltransferase [Flammeovirgaceae bacterium]|tara:strand:- start:2463 stop:3101 length:639 start_codon:yes stop_codon:yes gene_type:complete
MNFLPTKIKQYVETNSSKENSLLKEIARDTYLHVLNPRMLSGHYQGRILSFLSHMLQPRQILEIGTFTGYGTLCLAEGLASNGIITTIDNNEEIAERTRAHFSKSPFKHQIISKTGDALKIIPKLKAYWDLVFIDADKENYLNYYEMVLPKLNPRSFIIVDNVLWDGKVTDENKTDKKTKSMKLFNNFVHRDARVDNLLLPIRDGIMILRKK